MANSSILLDNEEKTEIPAAVRLAQQQGFLSMEKQPVVPVAKLKGKLTCRELRYGV